MTPTLTTSIAKTAAVRGVPNRAEKAAAMPHMTMTRRSLSSRPIPRPTQAAKEPPSCSAAPSRPAEPPTKWVRMVDRKMSGAVRSFSGSASRTATSTRLVPWSFSIWHTRYSSTIATPPTGASQTTQGCSPRSSVAQSMPKWNAAATAPANSPIPQAYSSHFKKIPSSRIWPSQCSEPSFIALSSVRCLEKL